MRISGASRHRRPRPSWDVRRAACSPLSFYKNAPFGGSKRGEALKSSWLLSRASLPLSMSSAYYIALKSACYRSAIVDRVLSERSV
jgi:hypothetical protein